MSMSKKDFIALADAMREQAQNAKNNKTGMVNMSCVLEDLVVFCRKQNPAFKRERWLDYVYGLCGPNGGLTE